MKRLKVCADRGDFTRRRCFGIGGDGRRAVTLKAAREDCGGIGLAQAGRIEKNPLGIGGELAAAGELGHGKAAAGEQAQRAFGTAKKKTMTITHAHEASDAMFALQAGGTEEDLQFTGALTGGVAG